MVACSECDRWFHPSCAKLVKKPTPEEVFLCIKCQGISNELIRLKNLSRATANNPSEAFMEKMFNGQQQQIAEVTKALIGISIKKEGNEPDWTVYLKRQALIRLPKFGGTAKDWPNFKKTFDDTTEEGA